MNGTVRYELAKVMIADRQREAEHARFVRDAQAARAARHDDEAGARPGPAVTRRVRALLRARTA
jgi:hypothetical protein